MSSSISSPVSGSKCASRSTSSPNMRRPVCALRVGREYLQRLPLHPEAATREHCVIARVLDRHEFFQQLLAVDRLSPAQDLHVHLIRLRRAQAINAGDRGDHDHVAAGKHGGSGSVAQPVYLLIDRRVLLDIQVPARHVRLGLVVVVVGDEVLDRIIWEESPELVTQLRSQRLVVSDHERRALHRLDRGRHCHRLAGPRRAQQRLKALVHAQPPRPSPRSPSAGRPSVRRRCRDGTQAQLLP